MFPQNQMNDLIRVKLNFNFALICKIFTRYFLHYKSKSRKVYNFSEYYLPIIP